MEGTRAIETSFARPGIRIFNLERLTGVLCEEETSEKVGINQTKMNALLFTMMMFEK
jgi:hypothetical protein